MTPPAKEAVPALRPLALEIVTHEDLGAGLRWLTLDAPVVAAAAQPGQFAHVRCGGGLGPEGALGTRRAYSLADADPRTGRIALHYRVQGRGTRWLAQQRRGERLDVLAPLGRGFQLDPTRRPVLVGGGTGLAPLVFLARRAVAAGLAPLAFLGARTKSELAAGSYLKVAGVDVQTATDDGSAGFAGSVVDACLAGLGESHAGQGAPQPLAFYSCGPQGMMAALAGMCRAQGWPLQVSLETPMACGIGICLSCTVPGPRDSHFYRRCCVEGPVFRAEEVAWE